VGDGGRHGDADGDGTGGVGGEFAGDLGLDDGGVAGLVGVEDDVGGFADEVEAVLVEGADVLGDLGMSSVEAQQKSCRAKAADLVPLNGILEVAVALGVHVVCKDEDAPFGGGHGKGSDAGHDIAYDLSGLEGLDETGVLRLELAVPVDFGVVEAEDAVVLADLDVHVVGAGEDLVGKGAEAGLAADVADLVDDGAELVVLVEDYLGDDGLEGEVALAEVEVGWARC
jgi:hypothetical protein